MNEPYDSKFNNQLNANYDVGNEIIYNTEALKSNLCNHNNAYILERGHVTVKTAPETQVSLTNCTSFTKCITKTDGTLIMIRMIRKI